LSIEAIFEFIAKNPPSILIAGGILCFILSVFISSIDSESAHQLMNFGVLLVALGVILHIAWLFLKGR